MDIKPVLEILNNYTDLEHDDLKAEDQTLLNSVFDSLDAAEILMDMEDRFDIEIDDKEWSEMFHTATVNRLVEFIKTKVEDA